MSLTTKQVSKKYNFFSLFYDLLETPIEKKYFRTWRKDLLKDVKRRVLEIGVGTGKNLGYYNHEKIDYVGIDISPGMLDKAKKRAKVLNLDVALKLIDSERLPFKDHYFDQIIATFLLCSVPNQEKMLMEMKRVLKPSGKILLLEHVLSKNRFIALFQRLHNPITKYLLGVNINRNTVKNIKRCGLQIVTEKNLGLNDIFKRLEVKQ